jgi:pimeloyl-ACP methyl ester carboxylesterase
LNERNLAPDLQAQRSELRASGLRDRDPEAYAQRLFELSVTPYFSNPARAHDLTPFRVTGRTQQEVWASLGDFDLRPVLPGLAIPAVVLHGQSDPIPIETAQTLAELLKAEFHPLPNCGHVPYVEAFEEFVRVMDEFLPSAL